MTSQTRQSSFPTIPPQAAGILVSLILAGLYLSVLPERLTDANFGVDGGDFLAAVLTRGIPHPSGYPTYSLFASLVQLLPLGSTYTRGVLASLIPAAAAGGMLTIWVITYWEHPGWVRTVSGALAGLAWGLAPLLFGQTVIVEVHGLQAFFITAVLFWAAALWTWQPGGQLLPLLAWSLLSGLGMGNHLTLALLLPPGFLGLAAARRRGLPLHWVAACLAAFGAGLLVYLYLPLAAQKYPPVNWGNPQTWEGFWWQISGAPYRALLAPKLPVLTERLLSLASLLMHQFGLVGLAAGVIGAVQAPFKQKAINGLLLWIFFVGTLFAALYNTTDSTAYLVPALAAFAVWIGLSLAALLPLNFRRIPVGAVLAGVIVTSLAVRIPGIRAEVDPRARTGPADFAEAVMAGAPQRAVVVASATPDTFALWYYHFGLHQRPDLVVISYPLTQFSWYRATLMHTYPGLAYPPEIKDGYPGASWGDALLELNSEPAVCRTVIQPSGSNPGEFACEGTP